MKQNRLLNAAAILIVGFATSACLNFGTANVKTVESSSKKSSTPATTVVTGPAFDIATIQVSQPSASPQPSPAPAPTFTIILNASNTSVGLNDYCSVQTNQNNNVPSKACRCHFEWNERNTSSNQTFRRTVETDLKGITNFQTQCDAPAIYNTEIPNGTVLFISIVPVTSSGNNSGFSTSTYSYTKSATSTQAGDFRDAEGHAFRNVYHYVCYDKPAKSTVISRQVKNITNPQTNLTVSAPVANSFIASSGASQFSGQSYYYDLYVRSNQLGTINAGNAGYTCPMVNIDGNPSFYPLDTTFAVAIQSSTAFPIALGAQMTIPTDSSSSGQGILGYAAKANSDGSCPTFADPTGRIMRTFRLRQYISLYPLRFQADGTAADQSQQLTTVYIIDRPVDRPNQDPFKPITRLGPKPCPFSFSTRQFGQRCSTDAILAGKNIDGTQIDGNASCPVYPPPPSKYLGTDGTLVIRPYRPFLMNFIENTKFKACAFPSSNPVDPEIVVSHDDGVWPTSTGPNDFYCSRHYPLVGSILAPPGGDPFDRAPGQCSLADEAAAIKTNKGYACTKTYDNSTSTKTTPSAGCCQICSGRDCRAQGGGVTAPGRNAAFNPPSDGGNPAQSFKALPRARPNFPTGGGCFDPSEDS